MPRPRRRVLATLSVAVWVLPGLAPAQEAGPEPPRFPAGAASVVMDLVVRDGSGRLVRDLVPADLRVREDGQLCEIVEFRRVMLESGVAASGPAATAAEATAGAPGDPEPLARDARQPDHLVTLAFDGFDSEGALIAHDAARSWLERANGPSLETGVVKLGHRLEVLSLYTRDPDALDEAIRVATVAGARERSEIARTLASVEMARIEGETDGVVVGRLPRAPKTYVDASATPADVIPRAPLEPGRAPFARVEAALLSTSLHAGRQASGHGVLWSLLALLRAQAELPGRKTVLFFSQGLDVTPELDDILQSAISEANRAGVSVYAIDVRGLLLERELEQQGRAIVESAFSSMKQLTQDPRAGFSKEEMLSVDRTQQALRYDSRGPLREIAEATGGLLAANSNDLRDWMNRMAEDALGYYLVTYVSPRPEADGSYRRIDVEVQREGVRVQSRSGYYALPPGMSTLRALEATLLPLLARPEPPEDFDYRVELLEFEPEGGARRVRLVAEVPLAELPFAVKDGRYALRLRVLALLRDARGRVVAQESDVYPLEGPVDELEGLRASMAVLRRSLTLEPGEYELEAAAAVEDGPGSVRRGRVRVHPAGDRLALSSLVVVRRVEAADEKREDDPLETGGLRVVPNLGAPLSKGGLERIGLYVVVFPGTAGPPEALELEILSGDQLVTRAAPALPAPERDGTYRVVIGLPAPALPAGDYVLRVSGLRGEERASAESALRLVR